MQVDTVIQIDPNDSDAALARLKPNGAVAPLAAIESYRGEPALVKLSFGKDSMALLLALLDAGVNVVKCVEADTGWEALEHYHYVAKMRPWLCDKYGIDIVTVRADISLPPDRVAMAERIEAMMGLGDVEVPFSPFVRRTLKYANFSSRMVKWCTDDIKIKPAKLWIKEYLETSDTDPLICTGIRGGSHSIVPICHLVRSGPTTST
jgi:3'-phosphoadenosine 5'-phosphosulfate sulfotransferase (PAPS reductase)/FAD synthetase